MYNLMDGSNNGFVPIIYCISIVFICSFFKLNLILAVILDKYNEVEQNSDLMIKESLEHKREELKNLVKKKEQKQKEMMDKVRSGIMKAMVDNRNKD